jgi:protein-disulfide isomerase
MLTFMFLCYNTAILNFFMGEQLPTRTPWYKTVPGVIFLTVFTVIAVGLTILGSMVVYYAWQTKYGDAKKLQDNFKEKFTLSSSTATGGQKIDHPEIYVRSDNATLGKDNAPITIIEFADFECPYSRESYPVIKQMAEKYAPVVKIVFKHLPAESIHPNAAPASLAAYCAGEENKFWDYHDLLFSEQKLDSTSLNNYATKLGLNQNRFSTCLNSSETITSIEQDLSDAVSIGVRGTPTFIVNGEKIEGAQTLEEWDKIILGKLQKLNK